MWGRWTAGNVAYLPTFIVSTGAGFRGCRTCQRLAVVLWSCVPPFCPLYRFVFGALLANMALFRVFRGFLGGFGRFVWVCVAWRFAWLVGLLYAWVVRRFYGLLRVCLRFSSFVLCFSSLPIFRGFAFVVLGLSFFLLLLSLFACWVFFFPCGLYAKKGAKVLLLASSLRLLWACLVVQILVTLSKNSVAVALARSNSFGW